MYLRGYGIEIEVYDKIYIDPADGQTKYFIPTGIISAQSAGVYLGDFVFGRTPEERSGSLTDGNLSIAEIGIAVAKKVEYGPPAITSVTASEIVLPSYEGMDSTFVIEVHSA